MARKTRTSDLTIERGRGATYSSGRWTVYEHSTYERHSVLAGQSCRRYINDYDTLEAAQIAHPTAVVIEGTTYAPPYLGHLSDDGDY
jgi:hypothetical protein